MCGFVGLVCVKTGVDSDWLIPANESLIHRGPDDSGEWRSTDGRVSFAHRRLSIIDLSPLGHQPMHHSDSGLTIIFNGEIYNFPELRVELESKGHQFISRSDTEVLLAAYAEWGTALLARLNGMFAFALYDSRRQTVFFARDRAGEKPIFYYLDDGKIAFASELKALLCNPELPRRIDPESLDCYLSLGFVPGERCILKGYRKLPPAHAMEFDLNTGKASIWRYWNLPDYDGGGEQTDEEALVEELESLLEDAVVRQCMADVPVGILLSGGVDSSVITAMAARNSRMVNTFTIGFTGKNRLDERHHAQSIANHFSTNHTVLLAEPTSAELLPKLAAQFDEPIVDSSMFPTYLVNYLVKNHCTVALGGEGGDELFGGYHHYSRLLWIQKYFRGLPEGIRRQLSKTASKILPEGFKGRNYLTSLETDLDSSLPNLANYFDIETRSRLMSTYPKHALLAESLYEDLVPKQRDLLQRATRMDFGYYLPEDILVKVDRSSMLNSLEVRAPFLDYRVIEFAFGRVPSHLKTTESEKKVLLKRLAKKILPPDFDLKRKHGFSIPLKDWLKKGPFRELFYDVLTAKDCLFESAAVDSLLKGQDRGLRNGERLFALVQFELWRKTYGTYL
jgi:asparagine synthase (glutamine-hydrolysing)